MAWVEKELKDHLVSTPLPWAGLPTTRPGCPEPKCCWPWKKEALGCVYVIRINRVDRYSLRCVSGTHCCLSTYSKLFTRFSQPSDTGEVLLPLFHFAATSCFHSFASSDLFLCVLCLLQGHCHHGSEAGCAARANPNNR